ncbi:MAG TPA: helix-turn-helix domain-containing protein [Puia sp.]|uniref:helix-turn-helix domain-containing protein n=1 Tax=Puia sp. TaxID=2045100 RepID=UPI002C517774|nr:helix-turn-helix domain-containing protein [Puia sp.]HVU96380.1 helix-turn-helix domain-containing protein [Puia sp.]
MSNAKTIGAKIAKARKKINLSQAQLAQRLFISAQAVGKWERGESMPDIATFNRLAEILGVDLNYFSEDFPSEASEIAPANPLAKASDDALSGKQVKKPGWDMSNGNWVEADFSGLKNLQEKFSSSNMQRCLFVGSELSGLLLKSNNVDNCDFSDSDISLSHIQKSHLANNLFKDCSLREAEFSGSYIMGCDFSGADFTGASFRSGGFEKNQIVNAVWNRTSFNDMYIADIVFAGTLEDCYFENCAFARLTFQNAAITNTFFKGKSLKRIRFIECKMDKLTHAFLKSGNADLSGVTLLTS